jgi:hypothetical protein
MRGTSGRKLTVLDAVILIASMALALPVMRTDYLWPDLWPATSSGPVAYSDVLTRVRHFTLFTTPLLASLSAAVFVLRLKRPRPDLRRLTRQPGFAACTATVLMVGIRTANLASVAAVLTHDIPDRSFWGWLIEEAMADNIKSLPSDVGCAVAVAWTIQAIGGRWRSEPTWIDRAGRVLGVLWVATIPFAWFGYMVNG